MKKVFILTSVVILITLGVWYSANINKSPIEPNTSSDSNFSKEKVVRLSALPNGQYSPEKIVVNVGTKLKIEADSQSLSGGMDTVIIDGYGIRKLISPEDNTIEFTADKKGTFKVYCANGMGNGILIVK